MELVLSTSMESDLLQRKVASAPFIHAPFHFNGIGPIPSSVKLFDSGQTPGKIE